MSDLLNKLLQASDWTDIVDAARALSARDNPSDVPQLIAALKDPLEQRRWGAVYALGFSRQDRRAVVPWSRYCSINGRLRGSVPKRPSVSA